jgi:hypothetical protein
MKRAFSPWIVCSIRTQADGLGWDNAAPLALGHRFLVTVKQIPCWNDSKKT